MTITASCRPRPTKAARSTNAFSSTRSSEIGRGFAGRDELSRRRAHEHRDARIDCEGRCARRSRRRRAAWSANPRALLQPRVHRARQCDPRHAEPDMVLIGESDPRAGDILAEHSTQSVCENKPPFRAHELRERRAHEDRRQHLRHHEDLLREHAGRHLRAASRRGRRRASPTRSGWTRESARKYLSGAIAYGGPCFPRDNRAFAVLARELGTEARLAEATDSMNEEQVHRLARIVHAHARETDAVGILGLTYKPDTTVVEESPGLALAELLAESGVRGERVRSRRDRRGGRTPGRLRPRRARRPSSSSTGPTWS